MIRQSSAQPSPALVWMLHLCGWRDAALAPDKNGDLPQITCDRPSPSLAYCADDAELTEQCAQCLLCHRWGASMQGGMGSKIFSVGSKERRYIFSIHLYLSLGLVQE
mmetsp:Transcript_49561/g.72734  ORF Transcript_49561/g.72734 Transcript_49561/m.72734 type:complete len:107 (-) Transcript_49561:43-363(-)